MSYVSRRENSALRWRASSPLLLMFIGLASACAQGGSATVITPGVGDYIPPPPPPPPPPASSIDYVPIHWGAQVDELLSKYAGPSYRGGAILAGNVTLGEYYGAPPADELLKAFRNASNASFQTPVFRHDRQGGVTRYVQLNADPDGFDLVSGPASNVRNATRIFRLRRFWTTYLLQRDTCAREILGDTKGPEACGHTVPESKGRAEHKCGVKVMRQRFSNNGQDDPQFVPMDGQERHLDWEVHKDHGEKPTNCTENSPGTRVSKQPDCAKVEPQAEKR